MPFLDLNWRVNVSEDNRGLIWLKYLTRVGRRMMGYTHEILFSAPIQVTSQRQALDCIATGKWLKFDGGEENRKISESRAASQESKTVFLAN